MPKRNSELYLLDILISIDRLQRFSSSIAYTDDLMKNEILLSAILRELSIIGEAMSKVLQTHELVQFVKPEWRDVVDFRNILIHEYFGLCFSEIYGILKKDLPMLEYEIISILHQIKDNESLQQALNCVVIELQGLNRTESLIYINKIKKEL